MGIRKATWEVQKGDSMSKRRAEKYEIEEEEEEEDSGAVLPRLSPVLGAQAAAAAAAGKQSAAWRRDLPPPDLQVLRQHQRTEKGILQKR